MVPWYRRFDSRRRLRLSNLLSVPDQNVFFSSAKKNWLLTGWLFKGALLPSSIWDDSVMHRMSWQVEICPKGDKSGNEGKEHYQVFVQFKERIRWTAVRKYFPLDFAGQKGIWWAISQTFGTAKEMDEYCLKQKTRKPGSVTHTYGGILKIERKSTKLDLAIADLDAGKNLYQIAVAHKAVWIRHFKGFESLDKKLNVQKWAPEYKLQDFLWNPITDWSRAHVFAGVPGIGKTQFALAHFKCPYIVSHIDDVLNFEPSIHDGIVFDDMCFTHLHQGACINIIDTDLPRSIHIRFVVARLPSFTKKIFTTNVPGGLIFLNQGIDNAIDRRLFVQTLIGPGHR